MSKFLVNWCASQNVEIMECETKEMVLGEAAQPHIGNFTFIPSDNGIQWAVVSAGVLIAVITQME